MTASVRIARVLASTAPAASAATGKSASTRSNGVVVRIAGVSATTVSGSAIVRLAGVTAQTTATSSTATVRIADVSAYAVQASYTWDGTQWVVESPSGVALGFGTGRSAGSRTSATTSGTAASSAKGTTATSVAVTRSGTLALSGTGSLTETGASLGANGKTGEIDFSGIGALTLAGNASQGAAGSGSVTVLAHADGTPPNVEIDLTGFLGPTAVLTRIDQAGNRTAVRGANPVALTGGTVTVIDNEVPYSVPVKYECAASVTVTSDPVEVDVTQPWLVHPGFPGRSQPLIITAVPVRSRDVNAASHSVLGRTNPIIVTDGARRAPTYELDVRTETADAASGLDGLLDDAQTLLLQIAYPDLDRRFYEWVAVGAATATSLTDYFGDDLLTWALTITVTDRPDNTTGGSRTMASVAAEFATLADLANNYATLADLAIDNLIGS